MKGAVAILGAGTQGRRLAYMWSSRGRPVNLIDKRSDALEAALLEIERFKTTVGKKTGHHGGAVTTFGVETLDNALSGAWLAVENVPESLELKRSVVKQLDGISDEDTIIASNSSSFTIQEIIEGLELKNSHRCVSLHSCECYYLLSSTNFANFKHSWNHTPSNTVMDWPPETSAIEVMGTKGTNPEIIPLLMKECKEHGFNPFHVKKNSSGYIYNRIWAAIKREALYVAAEGIATPEEIDEIYKDVLKTPKGPFEQMDTVGLDVVKDIEENYAKNRKALPQEPRDLLARMIQEGKLGVKTGEGFYKY